MSVDLADVWRQTLRTESARLADMPAEHLDAPVPTVDGWTLLHVVRHTGRVHRWARTVIEAGRGADVRALAKTIEPLAKSPECLSQYRESADAIVDLFEDADLSAPVQTFVGERTVGWWLRRQAHEVAVHRIDAADAVHAGGGPEPDALAAVSAADGVGETLELMQARFSGETYPADLRGATLHLHGTDTDGLEWFVTVGDDELVAEPSHRKADVALRGSAQDLLLVMNRRRPLGDLDTVGDLTVAERFLDVSAL